MSEARIFLLLAVVEISGSWITHGDIQLPVTSVSAVTSLGDNHCTSWTLHQHAALAIPLRAQRRSGSASVAVCLKHAEAFGTFSYFELERASASAAAVVKCAAA